MFYLLVFGGNQSVKGAGGYLGLKFWELGSSALLTERVMVLILLTSLWIFFVAEVRAVSVK